MKLAIAAALCASLAWSQAVKRPRITGVADIAFYAHDIDKSREFYTGFLGFQEPFSLKNPDGSLSMAFFKINDRQYVELVPETQAGTDRLAHIALETDDAAQMLAYLASRGVKTPARATKGRIGNTSFDITDPDGHTVEFVQYEPDGWSMREKGRFMNENRAADHMSHVGVIVASLDPALKFYGDILGCQDIWRGSQDGKYLSWVNMKVPDGDDWVEFMLYDQFPGLRQLGSFSSPRTGPPGHGEGGGHHGRPARTKDLYAATGSPVGPIQAPDSGIRSRRLAYRVDAAGQRRPAVLHRAAHPVGAAISTLHSATPFEPPLPQCYNGCGSAP